MNHQQILINGNATNGNMQTLQHYLINNHLPTNVEQPHQNVQVQIVKQEQAQHRFVINRQYLHQIQNPQVQVQAAPVYWVLVEIESNNDLNSYVLVEAKDIDGQPQQKDLTTGKKLTVNIDGKPNVASVVLASDDEEFIFNEYNNLKRMAEENLRLRTSKLRDAPVRKRRRISGSDMVRKDLDDDSSLSGWSGVSQNINTERVMSPSVHIQQKSLYKNEQIKPMMFDQGTQTDSRMSGMTGSMHDKIQELQRLIELNEQMLSEQKSLKSETKMSRLLVESFNSEFSSMRKSMQDIQTRFESLVTERSQYDATQNDSTQHKKKILNGSGTQPYFIIETQDANASENASLSLNGSNMEYTVEELEADDSGRSTSRMSYHDQTSMMSNSSMDFIVPKKEAFRRSHSSSNFSVNSASSTPIARANSNSSLIDEWAETEGDVLIGSNKTMVAVHVLRAMDWKNYKTATRKLLITLFTRETLATRSLTGRPSPAFHDRNKPVKGKLDQNIINDIIQIITRKCSVQESQVRTAITTKCADENKMLRNRKDNEEKEKFKTPTGQAAGGANRCKDEVSNKENVVNN